MRVWIDLTNSPHSLFFAPIAKDLIARGDEVLVTARHFAQTVELAIPRFESVTPVGSGSRSSIAGKVSALGSRVRDLLPIARKFRPDVAVSHGSQDQVMAARILRIPSLISVDYEYQPANHLSFRLARRLILPDAFDETDIAKRGGGRKTTRYRGLKEEVYLTDFQPDEGQRVALDAVDHDGPVVLLRPPPDGALYHRGENPLWNTLVEHLSKQPDTRTVILPRHPQQAAPMRETFGRDNVRVIDKPVDGPALVWWSDLVISGGGTMNREAVALGTPVWTLFGGILGSVDRQLIADGRMRRLTSEGDVADIRPEIRLRSTTPNFENDVRGQMISAIDRTAVGS